MSIRNDNRATTGSSPDDAGTTASKDDCGPDCGKPFTATVVIGPVKRNRYCGSKHRHAPHEQAAMLMGGPPTVWVCRGKA